MAACLLLPLLALLAGPGTAKAQAADSVFMRVVDVGPGLCTLTQAPGGAWMVYDAGHWQGARCIQEARTLIGTDTVDLMVISHADSDHLGDADNILQEFTIRRLIHTGYERPEMVNWERFVDAAGSEVRHEAASVRSLRSHPLVPGEQIQLGDAVITLLAGWGVFPGPGLGESHRRNAGSIVLRLDYGGRSILYAGDAVGREDGAPDNACQHAEEIMVTRHRSGGSPLAADVLLAPHHGADNGSSTCFIDAVDPEWVVFSAGHQHDHPRSTTAERYLKLGVPVDRMLRTDRGDDESDGRDDEWSEGRIAGCKDGPGDDDIDVMIWSHGALLVGYRRTSQGC